MNDCLRPVAAILICFGTAGCSFLGDVPAQFRIDQGVAPKYQDKDVRFRTTYYFRVFDVCEREPETVSSQTPRQIFTDKPFGPYKLRADSLYRFRMTGKTNAFFNKVHFESGTLRAEQIDPFGANIRHDEQTGNFKVISARQSRDESQFDAKRQEIEKLLKLRDKIGVVSGGEAELDNAILRRIEDLNAPNHARLYSIQLTVTNYMNAAQQAQREADHAAQEVLSNHTPTTLESLSKIPEIVISVKSETKKLFELAHEVSIEAAEATSATVKKLEVRVKDLEKDAKKKEELAKAKSSLDRALLSQKKARNMVQFIEDLKKSPTYKLIAQGDEKSGESSTHCTNGERARRGFQILGPEGYRTFDQDERLLMAFSYDAKPLISLLQELSSRKLSVRGDSESLREFANGRIGLRDALFELDKIKLQLEQGDPSNPELSAEETLKRIEKHFGIAKDSSYPKLDLSTLSLRP